MKGLRILTGWDYVPDGYAAEFRWSDAPVFIRAWRHIPFIDRFAYVYMVKRGHVYLRPHEIRITGGVDRVAPPWKVLNVDKQGFDSGSHEQ